jgi:hypothetical protein
MRRVLDLGLLVDRRVNFPVFEAEPSVAGEPTWGGWIEVSSSAAVAVSLVRGIDPSDPDAEIDGNESGIAVWSFDPRQLQGDRLWPANHASLFLGLEFARRHGITVGEGSRQMYDAVHHARQPIAVWVDGQGVVGSSYQFPPVGSVVSAVTPNLAFAAAFYLTPSTISFRSIAR